AQAELDDRSMVGARFDDDVAPPPVHDREDEQQAGGDDPPLDRLDEGLDALAQQVGMHAQHEPEKQDEGAERAERRPRAGIDQMVWVVRCAVRVGHWFSSPFLIRWQRRAATPWRAASSPHGTCTTE